MLELWILAVLLLLGALYLLMRWEESYFKDRGVKSLPSFPLVGHMLEVILQREHISEMVSKIYNAFPEEKYVGVHFFTNPGLLLRDLDIIKQITVKDFNYFQDRNMIIIDSKDDLMANSLVTMQGQKWKDMRSTLSPAFTSSKMRSMFDFVTECGEQMASYLEAELQKPEYEGEHYLAVEMKDAFTRYTNDVIATSAFGLKVDSLRDRENKFYVMTKESTNLSALKSMMKYLCVAAFPKLSKMLNISITSSKVNDFFLKLVKETMQAREEQNIVRPDMIHLLMQAKKGVLKHELAVDSKDAGFATVEESTIGKERNKRAWTDVEIAAQAAIFLFAGFDTSATVLCFLTHELMLHQDIQRKLQDEVDEVLRKNDGKLNYNALNAMKYMDMVVTEALRYWPPAAGAERTCVKPYTLPAPRPGGSPYELKVGDGVSFPILAIHKDPQYFPNPESFDPERFSDENKHSIHPASFLAFGIGPRNCIGSRFALMEVKAVVFHLLARFQLVATPKTQIPLKLAKNSFNFMAEKGFWVGFQPRQPRHNVPCT